MIQMARGAERLADEVFERVDAEGAGGGELGGGVLVEVEAYDFVTGETEALRHVEAHLAESDDSEFHVDSPFLTLRGDGVNAELGELIARAARVIRSEWRACRERWRRRSFQACRR